MLKKRGALLWIGRWSLTVLGITVPFLADDLMGSILVWDPSGKFVRALNHRRFPRPRLRGRPVRAYLGAAVH